MNIFLAFLYLFDFNIIRDLSFTSSALIVLLFLIFSVAKDARINKTIGCMLGGSYNRMIIKFMTVLVLLSVIVPIIQFTFDFAYTIALVHQLLILEIGIMLVGYYKCKKGNIIEIIINAFFIQSVIQLLCFLSPTILEITDIFREADTILRREKSYVGFRGLAISGSAFFGLAVSYAFLFVILAFYWDKWNKTGVKKLIYLGCMIFGALSAGRTSIIGILFFLIYVLLNKLSNKIYKSSLIRGILIIFFTCLIILPVYKFSLKPYIDNQPAWLRFSHYIDQLFVEDSGYSEKKFTIKNVSSLNNLFNNMYFRPTVKQVLIGDARYNDDGLYYMHTDVGYLRNLLFWGIGGTVLLYYYYVCILWKNTKSSSTKKIAIILIIMGFIFDVKGQTMGFLIISQSMLVLICNAYEFLDNDD